MGPTIVYRQETIAPAQFHGRVLRAAQVLASAGLKAGDVLALLMRNSPQMLELMLAARWLGAQWCPINWHFRTDEVQYILDDSRARVFVVDGDLLHALPDLRLDTIPTFVTRSEGANLATSCVMDWDLARDAASEYGAPAQTPRGDML